MQSSAISFPGYYQFSFPFLKLSYLTVKVKKDISALSEGESLESSICLGDAPNLKTENSWVP